MSLSNEDRDDDFLRSSIYKCALQSVTMDHLRYRKSSFKPPGGLFNFEPSRGGGLVKEGGAYSQNQVTRMYLVAFQFFYPVFCGIKVQFYGLNS